MCPGFAIFLKFLIDKLAIASHSFFVSYQNTKMLFQSHIVK
jgi:hypothetical protein